VKKHERDLQRTAKKHGADVISLCSTGNSHLRLTVRAPNGAEKDFIAPRTPSDVRSMKNFEAFLRNWLNANQPEQSNAVSPR
jgi:hypothetical protein